MEKSSKNEPSLRDTIEKLITACRSGMNWMDQVSRANIGSATRGILSCDMALCSNAIAYGKKALKTLPRERITP